MDSGARIPELALPAERGAVIAAVGPAFRSNIVDDLKKQFLGANSMWIFLREEEVLLYFLRGKRILHNLREEGVLLFFLKGKGMPPYLTGEGVLLCFR